MEKKDKKSLAYSGIFALILIVLDQLTKYIAVKTLKDQPAIPIIKDVFELKYLENTSAAFGMDPVSLLHRIFQFDLFAENPQLYLSLRVNLCNDLSIYLGFCENSKT